MIKPTIAVESITGCAGCQLTIYFQERLPEILEKFDIVSAPMIKGKNNYDHVDIIFLEGTVVNQEDLERLKELRNKCTTLVAIGECAVHGCMPTIKYQKDNQKIDVVNAAYGKPVNFGNVPPVPISSHVKVDHVIKGCPMDKKGFEEFIKDMMLKKKIQPYNKPLCYKCNLRENDCLLEQGKKCLGPITDGDCSVLCPSFNTACTGCRGFLEDSNLNAYIMLLKEKGYTQVQIDNALNKYAVIQYKELSNIQNGVKEPEAKPVAVAVSKSAEEKKPSIKKSAKNTVKKSSKAAPKKKTVAKKKPVKITKKKVAKETLHKPEKKKGIFHIIKEKLKLKKKNK